MLAAEGRLARIGALGQVSVTVASELAVVAVLGVGVPPVRSGALAGPELTLAALAALASFEAFGGLPAAFAGFAGSLASAERVFGLLDRKTVVVDPDKPAPLPQRFDLVLEKVCLTYPGAHRAALENIDIEIREGALEFLSIVGNDHAGDRPLGLRDPHRAIDAGAHRITRGGAGHRQWHRRPYQRTGRLPVDATIANDNTKAELRDALKEPLEPMGFWNQSARTLADRLRGWF